LPSPHLPLVDAYLQAAAGPPEEALVKPAKGPALEALGEAATGPAVEAPGKAATRPAVEASGRAAKDTSMGPAVHAVKAPFAAAAAAAAAEVAAAKEARASVGGVEDNAAQGKPVREGGEVAGGEVAGGEEGGEVADGEEGALLKVSSGGLSMPCYCAQTHSLEGASSAELDLSTAGVSCGPSTLLPLM
jgi:hypothetical protein